LPKPITVWRGIWNPSLGWPGTIWITTQEILVGFSIAAAAGIFLAILIAWTPFLSRTLLPFLIVFNTLPKVAIAPLFIIYLGYGTFPNAIIATMVAFFPIIIPSATGLVQIDQDWIDLARSLGAPKWKTFLRLRLPNSLPYVFGGLKVGSSLAVTGAVIGEFIASQGGLGNVILSTQTTLNTALAFAALFWLSLLGLLMYSAVALVERLLVPWSAPVGGEETGWRRKTSK